MRVLETPEPRIEREANLRHDQRLLARKISAFIQLSEPELEFLADLQSAPFTLERGKELVHEGQVRQAAFILQEGWACSFKMLPDGDAGSLRAARVRTANLKL
jgi:CRP-like cAMP-binding protein